MNTRRLDDAVGRFAAILEASMGRPTANCWSALSGKRMRRHLRPLSGGRGRWCLGSVGAARQRARCGGRLPGDVPRPGAGPPASGRAAAWGPGFMGSPTARPAKRGGRRPGDEREAKAVPRGEASEEVRDDLRQVLDEALARLPDRYREVVVLCELQGLARKDVARPARLPGRDGGQSPGKGPSAARRRG